MNSSKHLTVCTFLFFMLLYSDLHADKTSVTLDCPDRAAPGTEITIRVNVAHHGNGFLHYTDLVKVSINGTEIARWSFSAFNRPEAENFSREVKYRVTAPGEITAMGNCNIHGSTGSVSRRIAVP
jgi:desulfoferrodoxin (superoxide reductase-like protein)